MNPLDEAIKDLTRILGIMDVGTADRPRQMAAITVTIERIKSWRNVHVPKAGERGGTKTLEDVDEAKEDGIVGKQALRDAEALAKHLSGLRVIVARYTNPTDHEALPGTPGCKSCARKRKDGDKELDGHFNAVAKRYKAKSLCMFCGEHLAAEKVLPPLDIIDMYHRVSAQAAGKELARRQNRKSVTTLAS
jgi:hypothetical protein